MVIKHHISTEHKLNIEIRHNKRERERATKTRPKHHKVKKKMNNLRKAVKSYEYTLCIKRDYLKKKNWSAVL